MYNTSSNFTNFYVARAHRAFLNAYADDPNVISVKIMGSTVRVTLRDAESGIFPTVIDGIPFQYDVADPFEEAS